MQQLLSTDNILNSFLLYPLLGFISFAASVCFDKWIEPGNIFGFYYSWLLKIGQVEMKVDGHTVDSMKRFIKPMGFCIICANVWMTFIVFALAYLIQFTGYLPLHIDPIFILPTVFFANWLVIKFS